MKEIIDKRVTLTIRGDWTQREKLAIIFREEQIPASSPFECDYNSKTNTTRLRYIIHGSIETNELAKIYGIHTF